MLLAVCLALSAGGAHAQAVATVTMAEKPLRIIRGTAVYKASVSTIVHKDDMLETGAGGAQVEAGPDAIFALGPETRVYVSGLATDAKGATELQVLQGWVKLASSTAARPSVTTASFRVGFGAGAVIVYSKPGKDGLFADAGEQLAARMDAKGKPGTPLKIQAEHYAFALAGQPLVVQPRPASDFLGEMPPAFRDRLAAVPPSVRGGKLEAVKEREADFADVAPWLGASLPARQSFVARFRPRLKDAQFRRQLEQALGNSREWKEALNPAPAPAPSQSIPIY